MSSRSQSLIVGTIRLDDQEYSVNLEFQEDTIQLADALDLNELDAARLLLTSQKESEALDRSALASAIICFHENRQFLLECLRLVLQQSTDEDCSEQVGDALRSLVTFVVETKDGRAPNGSLFTRKCMSAMWGIEKWLQDLAERVQRTQTLGQTFSPEFDEMMDFQQHSLDLQHESLAAILTYLVKENHTVVGDFHALLDHMPGVDKWNSQAVHYVPILLSYASQYGSPERSSTLREARSIHSKIMASRETKPWVIPHLQAASITWWLAEYSGWYFDQPVTSPLQGVNLHEEAEARSEAFVQALQDGALQCTLSISSQIRPKEWYDPARSGLIDFLLQDAPLLPAEVSLISPHFQDLIMEQFETFSEAFITNMPDTLRRFKVEEDDQRRKLHSGLQTGLQNGGLEHDLHLERFLVIMSYAYEHRPDAAESFWSDPESNMYGFLQWASKRQSTPRVSAFCEMFRSISEGQECALAAHRFLLEESSITPGRLRRSHTLSWAQIFGELDFYASKIQEHPVTVLPTSSYGTKLKPVEIDEPESAMMLECYLRLTSHLCSQSSTIRSWVMTHESFHILDMLFLLCSSAVPKRIRACAYTTIQALLTEKTTETANHIWTSLDQWVSGGFSLTANVPRPTRLTNTSTWTEEFTFETIASDFEEANAFVAMLQALICSAPENEGLNDALPFPEQLGITYRMPGVDPYIDFVLGNIFVTKIPQLDDPLQLRLLTWNTLNFAATCLATFNEDLLILANRSNIAVDDAMNTSSLSAYARLHPFSRVMEWMFNKRVLAVLFSTAHQDINEVNASQPGSPLIFALLRSIDVMTLVMDLQSTYLDIVRPLVKMQANRRSQPVLNPALTSFEDSIANNLGIVIDLGLYCGSGHQDLVLSSLKLLGKLASSRKLNAAHPSKLGSRVLGNRLIGILEKNSDLEPVARSLNSAMWFDHRELAQGVDATGYKIKFAILDFLEQALTTSPERPSLAHALLGFTCSGVSIRIEDDSLFAKGLSLFHTILRLVIEYPNGEDAIFLSWSLLLKQKGFQILRTLWNSQITSIYTMAEMRVHDFLFNQFMSQSIVDPNTIWDDRPIKDPDFFYNDSALSLEQYLRQRSSIYEYASLELRLVNVEGIPSLKSKILSTLLGLTSTASGEQLENLAVLDLLDFMNLEPAEILAPPPQNYLSEVDFNVSIGSMFNDPGTFYNLKIVEELLALRKSSARKSGSIKDATEETRSLLEDQKTLFYFHGKNNQRRVASARMETLIAWVDLVTLITENDNLDHETKGGFVLRGIQIITPKLEQYIFATRPEALIFARFAGTLLSQFDFQSTYADSGRTSDMANDRVYQLFSIALRAISIPGGDNLLHEALYHICYIYLTRMAHASTALIYRRREIQAIKNAGDKLIDILCDDACVGEASSRVSALLLLDALAALAVHDDSKYTIDALVKTNFIVVVVESIKDIPDELRESDIKGGYTNG